MALDFRDGSFRVDVCEHGHVTLSICEDGEVKVVCTMTGQEAAFLAIRLSAAVEAAGLETVFPSGPAQL